MHSIAHAIALLALSGGSASHEIIMVSNPVRMSPDGDAWFECSVAVRQDDKNEVLVMAGGVPASGSANLAYATVKWAAGTVYRGTIGDCGGADVWTAAHPSDGTIWFAALQGFGGGPPPPSGQLATEESEDDIPGWAGGDCPGALVVGWKNPGDLTITNMYTHSGGLQDKPGLAIGGSPTTWFLLRMSRTNNCSAHQHEAGLSTNPQSAANWTDYTVEPEPNPPRCDYEGWGAAPVVLDDGRVVVSIRDEKDHTGYQYNEGLPFVVYSDDGIDWKPDDGFNPVRVGNGQIEATTTKVTGTGDTPYKVDRRNHAPSVAVDRDQSPNHVYVAFCARSAQGSTNTDIYIHKSEDRGESFPNQPQYLLQLTDTLLGVEVGDTGVDQFVPAIAVDTCGGINVMFYDNRHDPDRTDGVELVDVYYARIMGFGTATPSVQQWRLTPQSIRVDDLPASGFLGDYHNLAVSSDGKTIYAAYIGRDPSGGERTCYLHRININCIGFASDFTGDEKVDGSDLTAFMAAAASKDPSADLNLDWSVDDQDVTLFLKWFDAEKGK